jgi:hypothetical protein
VEISHSWWGTLLLALIIVVFAIMLMPGHFRQSSESKPMPAGPKDIYGDEISSAFLILGGTKEKIWFDNLVNSTWDREVSNVTLEQESENFELYLGAHDLLVGKGLPERCDFSSSYPIRIWAHGELIYEVSLANIEVQDRSVYGYDQDGADVTIYLGSGLTMVV